MPLMLEGWLTGQSNFHQYTSPYIAIWINTIHWQNSQAFTMGSQDKSTAYTHRVCANFNSSKFMTFQWQDSIYPLLLVVVVGWLLNVPATCECISGTDLLRQFYMLPHWDRSCRSNFPSHPVTVYWHRADQSQHWSYNTRQGSHWSANF